MPDNNQVQGNLDNRIRQFEDPWEYFNEDERVVIQHEGDNCYRCYRRIKRKIYRCNRCRSSNTNFYIDINPDNRKSITFRGPGIHSCSPLSKEEAEKYCEKLLSNKKNCPDPQKSSKKAKNEQVSSTTCVSKLINLHSFSYLDQGRFSKMVLRVLHLFHHSTL